MRGAHRIPPKTDLRRSARAHRRRYMRFPVPTPRRRRNICMIRQTRHRREYVSSH